MGSSQGKPTAPAMSPAAAAAGVQTGAFKAGVPCSGVQKMNDAADASANPFANGDCPVPEEYRGWAGSNPTCDVVCPPCHPRDARHAILRTWRPSFLSEAPAVLLRHVAVQIFYPNPTPRATQRHPTAPRVHRTGATLLDDRAVGRMWPP